jgi:hypothetical protein
MSKKMNRRNFMKNSIAVSAAAIGISLEEKALLAAQQKKGMNIEPDNTKEKLPVGKIGNVNITRLILGGNLVAGYAHSRNLIYVSSLLKNYFTEEKILETFVKAEENGINTVVLNNLNRDFKAINILNSYWKQGGKMQWLAQVNPAVHDVETNIKVAVDNGAIGAFVQGGIADKWTERGQQEQLYKAVEFIKQNGLIAGIGGHSLNVPIAAETAGIKFDFYFKTLNNADYMCDNLRETVDFMNRVEKPWIGYKVLGAGVKKPEEGFEYAFKNGADLICVGMFDFQISTDVALAKKVLKELAVSGRARPWRA